MHHPPSLQHQSHVSQPFFKHIFPSDSLCGQQKCQMWERACGGGSGAGEHVDSSSGRKKRKEGGMEREHVQRKKHCKKQ